MVLVVFVDLGVVLCAFECFLCGFGGVGGFVSFYCFFASVLMLCCFFNVL